METESATSLLPRHEKVWVGDQELTVREMTIEPWEQMMRRIRETLRIVDLAAPIIRSLGALGGKGEGDSFTMGDIFTVLSENSDIVGSLLERAFQAITEDVPYVAVLGLVNAENAEALGDPDDLQDAIRERLTVRQHFAAFEAVVRVNDFRSLLGKYSALWEVLLGSDPQNGVIAEAPEQQPAA